MIFIRTGNLIRVTCFFLFITIVTSSNSIPVKLKEVEGSNDLIVNSTSTAAVDDKAAANSNSPFSLPVSSSLADVITSSHLENPLQVLEALRRDFEQIRSAIEKTWPQSQSNGNSFSAPSDEGQVSWARSFLEGLGSIARRLPLVSQALTILSRSEAASATGSGSPNGQLNDQRTGSEAKNTVDVSLLLQSLNQLSKSFNSFHRTVQHLPSDATSKDEISKQEDIKLPLSPLHQRIQVHLNRMDNIRNRLNDGIRSLLNRWVDTNSKLVLPNGESNVNEKSASGGDLSSSQLPDPSTLVFDSNDRPFVLDQVKGSNVTSENEKIGSDFNVIRDAAAGVTIDTFKTLGSTVDTLRKSMAFLTQLYTKLFASYILQATSEQLHRSILDRIGGTAANIGNRVTGTFSTQVRSWMGTNNQPKQQLADSTKDTEREREKVNEVTSTSPSYPFSNLFGQVKETEKSKDESSLDRTTKNKTGESFDPFSSSPEHPYGSLHPLGVLSRELNQIIDLASSISNLG